MESIHNRSDKLGDFLRKNMEDLTVFVPEQIRDIVVKAEFGDFTQDDGGMCFLTEIYVRRMPDALEEELLREWIVGQMSDGWGENLEQREFMCEELGWTQPSFDPYHSIWVEEEFTAYAHYYVIPWTNNFCMDLIDDMVVEIDLPEEDKPTELELALKEINENLALILVKLNKLL
jgi:hypothetical protein